MPRKGAFKRCVKSVSRRGGVSVFRAGRRLAGDFQRLNFRRDWTGGILVRAIFQAVDWLGRT